MLEILKQEKINVSTIELSWIKPKPLSIGDTIGIFTPSWPGHVILREKYLHAIAELKRIGFHVIEGDLTSKACHQGYRTASAEERAHEFMQLIINPKVHAVMAMIGGWNSSSLIPYLDFEEIRRQRKIICGYSDLTALHFAIAKYSKLSTFYGPSLLSSFGEYPETPSFTVGCFLQACSCIDRTGLGKLSQPLQWSNHFIDAKIEGWKDILRIYQQNDGWQALINGETFKKKALIANLETLLSFAGTDFFPDVTDRILILEEVDSSFSIMERNYQHLSFMNVFNKISGLIISKTNHLDYQGCDLTREEILLKIIGKKKYPIITNFDCGHTFPMLTLSQEILLSVHAQGNNVSIIVEESMVEN